MSLTQTLLVVGSANAVLTLLALQTYLSEYSIGFASGQIQHNVNLGTVKATGPGGSAGGIVGSSDQTTVIQHNVNLGTVKATGPGGSAGGIVGSIGYSDKSDQTTVIRKDFQASGQIQHNVNLGTVKATGPGGSAGGIVGSIGYSDKSDQTTVIQNDFQGTVEATGPGSSAGGVVGSIKGDHNTIIQEGVQGTVKATGPGSSAGGAVGSIKSDHNTIIQEGVQVAVEAGPGSCAGGAVGSIGNCGTGVKTGNSHGNDYSGGDGDDNDHEIQNLNDLIQAVRGIGNWRALCTNLGVDDGVMETLVHSTATEDTKKADCLRAYFNGGKANWADVIEAVTLHPINNRRVANQIAKTYGLDDNSIVKEEL